MSCPRVSAFAFRRMWAAGMISFSLFSVEALWAIETDTPSQIAELLVSDRSADVARGEAELSARRTDLVAGLLARIRDGNANVTGRAAYELGIFLSPWIRGKEAGARFREFMSFDAPRRPVEKVPQIEGGEAIRRTLEKAISRMVEQATNDLQDRHGSLGALQALCETLGEVADDETMDWVMARLPKIKAPTVAEPLVMFADSYLGIPPVFRNGGMCGNSTETEVQAFQTSQESALSKAEEKLSGLWREIRPLTPPNRIAFAMKSWRDDFVPIQRAYSGSYLHEGWLFRKMEPLVRFGSPAVPLLRAQQAQETELEARGVWEVVIGTITGHEDATLMRALFSGRDPHLELACEVATATGSTAWLPELETLQCRNGFDGGRASIAIANCYRAEGISALKKGLEWSAGNFNADCALKELAVRATAGPPHGMRRYSFPTPQPPGQKDIAKPLP